MIVTFYSYKGGTGRTMALANIACLLARFGRRVLVVDFDLEAPGIWRYFAEFDRHLEYRAGLLDLLLAHANRSHPHEVDWRRFTTKVRIGAESITLMTSGALNEEYPARVLDFDWADFFRRHEGGQFFEQLRSDWNREYDFVLVDSRTGITDIGGICTIVLPDLIVPVFVANNQNLDGIVDTLRRAQRGRQELAYDRTPALVLPVLSRFDSRTELESANEWLTLASGRLGEFYADWLPQTIDPRVALERTKLPYIAYFGFGEKLAVLLQGITDPESLGYALNSIARLIDSNLKDVRTVILGTDQSPSTSRVSAIRLEPPFDTWIAAVHVGDNIIGTAIAIDRKRLLTTKSLIDQASGSPLEVSFPKSSKKEIRSRRYRTLPVIGSSDGAAIIRVRERYIPSSAGAAPIQFPHAEELTGRRWWSFGFSPGNRLGNSASGTVGATLAFGAIRLDTESNYQLGAGFAGAPIWSPDYSAVVGIVILADQFGSGVAIPLSEVADDFPKERLRRLAEQEPGSPFDANQRKALIDTLTTLFSEAFDVTILLEDAGVPTHGLRPFESFRNPHLYWEHVVTAMENGLTTDGVTRLVRAASELYPANTTLRALQEAAEYNAP